MRIIKSVMARIISRWKLLLVVGGYIFLMWITKIGCIFNWLTGIPCPACGITRSCVAFLRLDIKKAFEYHALTLLLVPFLIYILIGERPYFKSRKSETAVIIILTIITFSYYLFRLFFLHNDIIYLNIEGGELYKLAHYLGGLLRK